MSKSSFGNCYWVVLNYWIPATKLTNKRCIRKQEKKGTSERVWETILQLSWNSIVLKEKVEQVIQITSKKQ